MFKIVVLFLLIFSHYTFALNHEIKQRRDNVTLLSEYLDSLGIADARFRSKCKKNNCKYWLQIGDRRYSANKETQLLETARYRRKTYALYANKDSLYIANQRSKKFISKKNKSHCSTEGLARSIGPKGELICVDSAALYINEKKIKLPITALSAHIGISYKGYWQLAFVGEDLKVYIGDQRGFESIDVGLNSQSDFKKVLHLFPQSSNSALLSVYVYNNKRNKSLLLYRISKMHKKGSPKIEMLPIINTIESDAGLNPEVYVSTRDKIFVGSVALSGEYQYQVNEADFLKPVNYDNPHQGQDTFELLTGVAIRQTQWNIDQEVKGLDKNDKKLAKVKYKMNQSILSEFSLQGKLMGNPIALNYAKSVSEKGLNDYEKAVADRLYGYIGINDIFKGGSTLRIEYRQENASGTALWKDNGIEKTTSFKNKYVQYSLLKTEEQGLYKGISYSENNIPTAMAFLDDSKSTYAIYFDPTFEIKKLSFTMGYDVSQYTSRYMFDYHGGYISPRFSVGIYQYDIDKAIITSAETHFGKKFKDNIGLAFDGSVELGYIIQRRSLEYGGAGLSLQIGVSIDADLYLNSVSDDSEIDDNEIAASFNRTDIRYGPFVRLNAIF